MTRVFCDRCGACIVDESRGAICGSFEFRVSQYGRGEPWLNAVITVCADCYTPVRTQLADLFTASKGLGLPTVDDATEAAADALRKADFDRTWNRE
jgi:hypothetical protein